MGNIPKEPKKESFIRAENKAFKEEDIQSLKKSNGAYTKYVQDRNNKRAFFKYEIIIKR